MEISYDEEYSLFESQSDSKEPNSRQQLLFICQKCKKIPRIFLRNDNKVEIACNCFEFEAKIEDENNKMPITDLTKFKTFIITLDRFLKENNKAKIIPDRCNKSKHEELKADSYCKLCKEWYCREGSNEHKKYAKDHISIRGNDMMINSTCENPNCTGNWNLIQYYCKDCHFHLCNECKHKHPFLHSTDLIKDLFDERKEIKFQEDIQSFIELINLKRENEQYQSKDYFLDPKYKIQEANYINFLRDF